MYDGFNSHCSTRERVEFTYLSCKPQHLAFLYFTLSRDKDISVMQRTSVRDQSIGSNAKGFCKLIEKRNPLHVFHNTGCRAQ